MSKKLLNLINQSTNSVNQARSAVFLPYSNIENTNIYKKFVQNKNKGLVFENGEYKINVRNRLLYQSHRDILDIVFSQGLLKMSTNGQYYAEFRLYFLLKKLGKSQCGKNRTWLKEKIQDLVDVVINLESKGILSSWSDIHILDKAQYCDKVEKYVITFNSDYINSFKNDILINYDKYLPDILAIRDATIKAFIRYILVSDRVNYKVKQILNKLDIYEEVIGKRQFNKIKQRIKNYDFSKYGFEVKESEQILCYKQPDVIFWTGKKEMNKGVTKIVKPVKPASTPANNITIIGGSNSNDSEFISF